MAVLVAEQSEMISSIETNIGNATDYMKEATQQLKKANKLQKRSRKVSGPDPTKNYAVTACVLKLRT
jgi:t-SNARE complex subunit (syntaxin)